MVKGYKTSELWVTIASQLLTVVIVFVNGAYGKELDIAVYTQVAATAGAFVQSLATAIYYTRARATVKSVDIQVKGGVK